jgi:outer membrane protein TolC
MASLQIFKATVGFLLVFTLSGFALADPAPSLSLEQAVSGAKENSPLFQKAIAAAHEADWKRVGALSGFLPSLNASAGYLMASLPQQIPFEGQVFKIPPDFTLITINASLPIFDGLQNVNRYSSASLESDAAAMQAGAIGFQVEQEAKLKFYQALAAGLLAEVATENVKTLKDHLTKTQVIRRGGAATNYDVLRIEVQLDEAVSEKLQAEDNVVLARETLAEAMGQTGETGALTGELPKPVPKEIPALDLKYRVDIGAELAHSKAQDRLESAASAYWIPQISLQGQYQFYNNVTTGLTDSMLNAYSLGVFVTWNLFDGMSSIARSRESVYQRIEAEKAAEISTNHAPNDYDLWKRRYQYSTTLYHARTADVAKAEESVRLATEGFKVGSRTTSEVLDAELDLFRARAGVVTAQVNAAEALTNLELSLGRKL